MGTKKDPSKFDCYSKAMEDEPRFALLARDPDFERMLHEWANRRELAVNCGERPAIDIEQVSEARKCAAEGALWRRKYNSKWRAER